MAGRYNVPLNYVQWSEEDKYNVSPVFDIVINRKKHQILLDTGASICFIDRDFVEANKYLRERKQPTNKPEFEAHTVGGISSIDFFIPNLNFKIGTTVFIEDFYIIDVGENSDTFCGLVGFNFLMKNKINIDIEKLFLNLKK